MTHVITPLWGLIYLDINLAIIMTPGWDFNNFF